MSGVLNALANPQVANPLAAATTAAQAAKHQPQRGADQAFIEKPPAPSGEVGAGGTSWPDAVGEDRAGLVMIAEDAVAL